MTETVFRTRETPEQAATQGPQEPADKSHTPLTTDVEPPYLDYSKQKGHSYILDHFNLGEEVYDSRVFETEVETLEGYLEHQINKGELNNTIEAVKNEIKRIEKLSNAKQDANEIMRLDLVSEYAKFILASENIKLQHAKYRIR